MGTGVERVRRVSWAEREREEDSEKGGQRGKEQHRRRGGVRDETGTPTGNRYAPAPPRPPLSRYSRYSSALENPKDRACWRACSKLGRVRPPANLSVRSARGATGSPRRRGCSAGGRRSGRRSKPGTDGAPEAAQGPAARAPMRHSSGLGAKAPVAGRGSQEPRASSTSKAGRDMPGARAPVAARSSPGELLRLPSGCNRGNGGSHEHD